MGNPKLYTCTFDRIGRNHGIEPLAAAVVDADDLAAVVFEYARPHLLSRNVNVLVDLEKMTGVILCGFHTGGRFTIAEGGEPRG